MGDIWLPLLPTWLRNAGLDVEVWEGSSRTPPWSAHSRSTGGYGDAANPSTPGLLAIQRHHTANPHDRDIFDLLRRLADSHIYRPVGALCIEKRTGRWGVVAAGATNTSGRSEGPLVCSRGVIPQNKGNLHALSIEADNDGVGEEWTDDMLDSYNLGVAAIIKGLRDDGAYDARLDKFVEVLLDPTHPGDHHSHEEYTARKIDPAHGAIGVRQSDRYARADDPRYGRWRMGDVRADTAAVLAQLDNPNPGENMDPISYEVDELDMQFGTPVLVQLRPDREGRYPYAAALKLAIVNATAPGRVEAQARGVAFVDEDGDGIVDVNRGSFPAALAGLGAFPVATTVPVDEQTGQIRLRLNGSPDIKPRPTARVDVAVEAVWYR